MAYPRIVDEYGFDGRLMPGDLRLDGGPDWFIVGKVAEREENFQGYHAAHKLILGDEATAINDAVAHGIVGLLASGDSRLCLILNPTTADTYAANLSRSAGVETIKITAWDTPHFTGEDVPDGSNLITPRFLEELKAQGMGPGTYEWTTRVMADFWDSTDDTLLAMPWITDAYDVQGVEGTRALGIDMATYGSNENVITYRDGNEIVWQRVFPSMRMENFWQGPVLKAVMEVEPHYVIYDADGVGAGVSGLAEDVSYASHMTRWGGQILSFRGAISVEGRFRNNRSMWWWALRRRLEAGLLSIRVRDPKLEGQLTGIKYGITNTGDIRVESKLEMKKRNVQSPDRADSMMYACALADDLPMVQIHKPNAAHSTFGVADHSERGMWNRTTRQLDRGDGSRVRDRAGYDEYKELEPYPLEDW
jgi:phage terminase large subunit